VSFDEDKDEDEVGLGGQITGEERVREGRGKNRKSG
jgi:hypothetical protein